MSKCPVTKKQKFNTRLDAQIDMSRIQKNAASHRKMTNRELPTRTYQCEFCRTWHHTSQTKRRTRVK